MATPLTYWVRIGHYIRQTGARPLTPAQRRRLRHKHNRAGGPVPDPWAWVSPAEQQLAGVE